VSHPGSGKQIIFKSITSVMQIKMTIEAGAKSQARFKLFKALKVVFASKEIKSFKINFKSV